MPGNTRTREVPGTRVAPVQPGSDGVPGTGAAIGSAAAADLGGDRRDHLVEVADHGVARPWSPCWLRWSVLMAMMFLLAIAPTQCWIAPEMPQAK